MKELYSAQALIWDLVFDNEANIDLDNLLLCGGTALTRFHLDHRVSYDLDFFSPTRFNPDDLQKKLSKIGLNLLSPIIENREGFCRQLSGHVVVNDVRVKIDFIEDIFDGMFAVEQRGKVLTEVVDGLFHRKVRTLSGTYSQSGEIKGARQTARDLFDLYVLHKKVKPVNEFVSDINRHGANIPVEGLINGIIAVPWVDLVDEFDLLDVSDEWKNTGTSEIRRLLEKDILSLRTMELDNDNVFEPK